MAYTNYDRLTALDATFLDAESRGVHMHVGSVAILDGNPAAGDDGPLDFEQVLHVIESGLRRAPRLRQKLAHTPLTGSPVWVDDEHFNVLYHVRHTALPLPGDERRLKRLVGRIMSEKLDLRKPLWELWLVEGLEGGRSALVSKLHHCLVDGISGVDLFGAFMGRDPEHRPDASDHRWLPRPAPGGLKLLTDEVWRRATLPGRTLARATDALRDPERAVRGTAHQLAGLARALSNTLEPASETPFNVPIGPHRRFDWTRFDLGVVREVKQRIGGTINDVVLACVAGAVRQYLRDHGVRTQGIDFRAFVPVSTRTEAQRGSLGNRVSLLVAPLPVAEADARKRAKAVIRTTRELKKSGQAEGGALLEDVSDWTAPALLSALNRLAAARRTYNLIVTNVPGLLEPVYLDGRRMRASYPLVPLFEGQALGIAVLSCDDGLCWGFNADWDALPDLHDFVLSIEREFETLRKL